MAFIKNMAENLIANEFRPINNFYSSPGIGEDTEYIGFVRQIGNITYGIVIINADKKYDYKGFFADTLSFFSQLERVMVLGIFASDSPDEELTAYCTQDIEDYQAELISIKWIADTGNNKLRVKGSQPDELLNIHSLVYDSFGSGEYSPSVDIGTLREKQRDMHRADIKSSKTPLTWGLITINGIVLILMEVMGGSDSTEVLLRFGAIDPDLIFKGMQFYRVFTSMFLHIGLMHYLANSLSLYILGSRVERYFGSLKMLVIYIFSGIVCGFASALFSRSISAGASGAIFGLMAAIFIYTRIKKRSMDGFDNYFIILFAIIGIGSGMLMPNVDNIGHIGGFIGGLIISRLLLGDKNE